MTRNIAPTYTAHFAYFIHARGYSLLASAPSLAPFYVAGIPSGVAAGVRGGDSLNMAECLKVSGLLLGGRFVNMAGRFHAVTWVIITITINADFYGHDWQSQRIHDFTAWNIPHRLRDFNPSAS